MHLLEKGKQPLSRSPMAERTGGLRGGTWPGTEGLMARVTEEMECSPLGGVAEPPPGPESLPVPGPRPGSLRPRRLQASPVLLGRWEPAPLGCHQANASKK